MTKTRTADMPARILIVDDNPVNLGFVVENLEHEGYEVLVALSGHEALERAVFAEPDLILLDVMMPGLNGFETCQRLKLQPHTCNIPIIFMTALNDVADKVAAFAAGGVDYISKPFQTAELLARVRTHLALRAAESSLRDSELHHRRLFEVAGDGILVIDCQTEKITDLNAQCSEMLGLSREEACGLSLDEIPALRIALRGQTIVAALREEGHMKWDDWSWERQDGSTISAEVIGRTYRVGTRLLAQCTFRDISARKEAEARVRYLASHDALTGLPNRTLLLDRLNVAIAQARDERSQVGLLLLDLDHFKHVNDSLGHFIGDELLEEVSKRLRTVIGERDTAARLGGDEFVIAAPGLSGAPDAEALAKRILQVLAPLYVIQGRRLYAGATIGISLYPSDGDNPAALLQAADTAMYQAKKKRRGTYRLFSRDLSVAAERWHALSNDMHGACERGEFVIHYQPQMSLKTGTISGLEALLRWQHPTEGLIAPGLFIPLLEEHGRMVEVGQWVLQTACAQNAAWQAQGLPPVRIAVNLSGQQFYRGDIVGTVRAALAESGLSPEWLELELTESLTLDDTEATLRIMHDLKALGVELSLDDFGTGWSSLAYLKRFPLDRIKIDRSFVRDLVNDTGTAAIVQSILDLAGRLEIDCIAEGVETTEQFEHLRRSGCSAMQGFLFSRAVCSDEIAAFLEIGAERPDLCSTAVRSGKVPTSP